MILENEDILRKSKYSLVPNVASKPKNLEKHLKIEETSLRNLWEIVWENKFIFYT